MTDHRDTTVDVLVAGSGAAGLTAAVTAADRGLDVLVVESTPSPERRTAFVRTAPEVVAFLGRHGVRWRRSPDYPDHYPDRPGGTVGRSIESAFFDTKPLGDRYATSRAKESGIPLPLMTDDVWLLSRAWSTPGGFVRGARFDRGRTVYDNYYGDPRVKPNPDLGPLERGPFRAVRVHPGDLGTKGGLLTDEHARVLREDGTTVPGPYAAGNTTASVMGRTYPGPGLDHRPRRRLRLPRRAARRRVPVTPRDARRGGAERAAPPRRRAQGSIP